MTDLERILAQDARRWPDASDWWRFRFPLAVLAVPASTDAVLRELARRGLAEKKDV